MLGYIELGKSLLKKKSTSLKRYSDFLFMKMEMYVNFHYITFIHAKHDPLPACVCVCWRVCVCIIYIYFIHAF